MKELKKSLYQIFEERSLTIGEIKNCLKAC